MNTTYITARVTADEREAYLGLGGGRWFRRMLAAAISASQPSLSQVERAQQETAIAEAYRQGLKVEYIRAEYRCSLDKILRIVDAAGIPRRGKNWTKRGAV